MIVLIWGSSPLTRGKRLSCADDRLDLGLIPAHAGKTCHGHAVIGEWRAHPRSRGENSAGACPHRGILGSSPLTRGKHLVVNQAVPRRGLIPAHAGKTAFGDTDPKIDGAHPRSRGENFPVWVWADSGRGSSPLTRGKHEAWAFDAEAGRLIPAHAGKTVRYPDSRRYPPAHPRSRGEN